MSAMRKKEHKILSFSTTMRNPWRIADFLKILSQYENKILNHETIIQIINDLIQNKIYIPIYASNNYKEILKNDKVFTQEQINEIIINSPQNHKEAGFDKGWDSRFDTFYKLSMEFGFCFYAMNEVILISNTGYLLIEANNKSNDEAVLNIFLNAMMKYQSNNPFRANLSENIPLLLLLNTIKILKQKINDGKIHKSEIAFFLCWKNDDSEALADFILDFRKDFKSFKYSDDIIYEKCLQILNSTNTKRFKKSQISKEAIDEYIRKMRITGIISLRGGGYFLDFNHFEMPKINYVIKNYSHLRHFKNKKEYFEFMGQIDKQILEFKEQNLNINLDDLKQKTLEEFAKKYSKEKIFSELKVLNAKNSYSKDEVFKFIPEPTRFEFLTSIALKQYDENLRVLPNYSVDDEGLPKCHASGNLPDIVCENLEHKSIVEVSLLCGAKQTTSEILPIARHLKALESQNKFAIFIAPKIHEDSKRYARLIKLDENLEIKNYEILNFIKDLKDKTILV